MPLKTQEDYPEGADMEVTKHCKHCGTKEGLYAYGDLVKGMTEFMVKTQGMKEEEAKKAAKQMIDNCEAVSIGMLEVEEE
jgi:hypothetical protein